VSSSQTKSQLTYRNEIQPIRQFQWHVPFLNRWTNVYMYVCMYNVCMQKLETDNLLRTLWCILMAFCFVLFCWLYLSITLGNDQLDAQIFNTFITILYMYMFRTISCSSSGDKIVLIQCLVSSLSVSDRPVHRLRKNLCTGRSLTEWRYKMLY
jgi:hypothetical protein